MTQDGSESAVLAEGKAATLPFEDYGPGGKEGRKDGPSVINLSFQMLQSSIQMGRTLILDKNTRLKH